MTLAKQEQIASYLLANPSFPFAEPLPLVYARLPGYGAPQSPTAEEIGKKLLDDAEFRALGLGSWLGTTDGEIIAGAVEQFLPPLYRQDAELLVEALKFAANLQQAKSREVAGAWALGSIGAAIFLAVGIKSAKLRPAT
jgi:hypothetical protein